MVHHEKSQQHLGSLIALSPWQYLKWHPRSQRMQSHVLAEEVCLDVAAGGYICIRATDVHEESFLC